MFLHPGRDIIILEEMKISKLIFTGEYRMNHYMKSLAVGTLALVLGTPVMASSVFLVGDSNLFSTTTDNEVLIQNIFDGTSVLSTEATYNALTLASLGTTATETIGAINDTNLAGKDFLLTGYSYSRNSFTGAEILSISHFVSGGGSLFLVGEGNPSFSPLNSAINLVLAAVGSTMRLSTTDNFDNGGFTSLSSLTTGTPFGSGINGFTVAYASSISLGTAGQAVVSGIADASFGTAVGFESLSAVPVPAAIWLFGTALIGLVGFGKRRKAA